MTIDLSFFSPIADILVLEKRTCRKCGFGGYIPGKVLRLYTSHSGPVIHTLQPRKPDDLPLEFRGTHCVETLVESCMNCWQGTHSWEDLISHVPARPEDCPAPRNGTFASTATRMAEAFARASAAGVSREARTRMNDLMTSKPAPTLEELLG